MNFLIRGKKNIKMCLGTIKPLEGQFSKCGVIQDMTFEKKPHSSAA